VEAAPFRERNQQGKCRRDKEGRLFESIKFVQKELENVLKRFNNELEEFEFHLERLKFDLEEFKFGLKKLRNVLERLKFVLERFQNVLEELKFVLEEVESREWGAQIGRPAGLVN